MQKRKPGDLTISRRFSKGNQEKLRSLVVRSKMEGLSDSTISEWLTYGSRGIRSWETYLKDYRVLEQYRKAQGR